MIQPFINFVAILAVFLAVWKTNCVSASENKNATLTIFINTTDTANYTIQTARITQNGTVIILHRYEMRNKPVKGRLLGEKRSSTFMPTTVEENKQQNTLKLRSKASTPTIKKKVKKTMQKMFRGRFALDTDKHRQVFIKKNVTLDTSTPKNVVQESFASSMSIGQKQPTTPTYVSKTLGAAPQASSKILDNEVQAMSTEKASNERYSSPVPKEETIKLDGTVTKIPEQASTKLADKQTTKKAEGTLAKMSSDIPEAEATKKVQEPVEKRYSISIGEKQLTTPPVVAKTLGETQQAPSKILNKKIETFGTARSLPSAKKGVDIKLGKTFTTIHEQASTKLSDKQTTEEAKNTLVITTLNEDVQTLNAVESSQLMPNLSEKMMEGAAKLGATKVPVKETSKVSDPLTPKKEKKSSATSMTTTGTSVAQKTARVSTPKLRPDSGTKVVGNTQQETAFSNGDKVIVLETSISGSNASSGPAKPFLLQVDTGVPGDVISRSVAEAERSRYLDLLAGNDSPAKPAVKAGKITITFKTPLEKPPVLKLCNELDPEQCACRKDYDCQGANQECRPWISGMQCFCKSGFKATENFTCSPIVNLNINDRCNEEALNEERPPHTVCKNSVVVCNSYYEQTLSGCVEKKSGGFGSYCDGRRNGCNKGEYGSLWCDVSTKTCRCYESLASKWSNKTDRCEKREFGDECASHRECHVFGDLSTGGYTYRGGICVIKKTAGNAITKGRCACAANFVTTNFTYFDIYSDRVLTKLICVHKTSQIDVPQFQNCTLDAILYGGNPKGLTRVCKSGHVCVRWENDPLAKQLIANLPKQHGICIPLLK